jgi:beta-lactamase regulating signal transducer with metallopeptidase domain|tara:strand:- start:3303 stop:3572 length:270 start_codon:yes stop_codon:yes gene_type:complete
MDTSLKEVIGIIIKCIVLVLVISILIILFKRIYHESYMNKEDKKQKVKKRNEYGDETFKLGEEFKKPVLLGDIVKMFSMNYKIRGEMDR